MYRADLGKLPEDVSRMPELRKLCEKLHPWTFDFSFPGSVPHFTRSCWVMFKLAGEGERRGRSSAFQSCGSHHVGTILRVKQRWILHTQLRANRSASRNYSVTRQRGNLSNNDPSRHLVGTLTTHWPRLFTFYQYPIMQRNHYVTDWLTNESMIFSDGVSADDMMTYTWRSDFVALWVSGKRWIARVIQHWLHTCQLSNFRKRDKWEKMLQKEGHS